MHIPNHRIYNEMRSEEGGAWFVPANGGKETAVLIKAPTPALKALISGCSLSFVFAIQETYLCCGVRIYDVPNSPLLMCQVQRHDEEHDALRMINDVGRTPIFLFNEMDVCVAWSDGILEVHGNAALNNFIPTSTKFYSGIFTDSASKFLDVFCAETDSQKRIGDSINFRGLEVVIEPGPWTSNKVSFAGFKDSQTIILSDADEGAVLEKAIWASLESVFPYNLYKSPQVFVGKKQRELVDVAAFYEHGSFFIEAKDLSIFAAGTSRTRERRLLGTQKQARKAIDQLVGASKAAKRGELVTDKNGDKISLVLNRPLHCIVLLSELMHEGDWSDIEEMIRKAMAETRDFFHVLDLRELITILKCSNGDPHLVDFNLMKRCEQFMMNDSLHIRSRPAPV